ncbi:bifunctional folylpolyglutamate synthase/dihydrofolate synthase [Rhodomicrobium vannielii ATCC 17100]|uniref:bifunctional folylpolyglutamate synthase/dihydrofolate synthase n=1 Tax=Rhodomicrobium vannielii TaxID=1069 RepID=UPI001919A53D|nr:folylpolyglutamate synthase/dihydrofolate synthase family protein [Rhodomicrobium vannielii]MBJ7535259.1 bifunctional folylpolyglutamate synthase/dihydrofolate synthase [Rhodomicrobium vannielii ATCC 17100]
MSKAGHTRGPRNSSDISLSSPSDSLLARLQTLHPKSIDLSLGRVHRLLRALGDPHRSIPPVIHVAGTNGKGSVVAFLKAMLEASGYRAHVFTSPHLVRFHERIQLAAQGGARPISESHLADVLARTETANRGEPITFFEITTAAAFLAFAENPADIVLLETGLGGRLDATNVIDEPLATVLTAISIDHCSYLGDSIEAIAGEKAGILKRGRPAIVSRQSDEAMHVIAMRAAALEAPVIAAGASWDVFEQQGHLVYQDEESLLDLPLPRLVGRHQFENAGTAIASARNLEGFHVSEAAIAKGITSAVWPARLERLGPGRLHALAPEGSEIWVDGGHNPAAGEVVARALADLEERVSSPIHLIVGMLSTKDAGGFLRHFQGLPELTATIDIEGQTSAYKADELAAIARREGLAAEPAGSLEEAFAKSRAAAKGPVRIVIAGSLYLAGQVLAAHAEEPHD